jgi:hypothetical protein
MSLPTRTALGMCLCLAGVVAQANAGGSEAARIRAERAAAQSQFETQQRECAARFAVNACVDEARKQRRDSLAALKRRQMALDEAERQQRSAKRQADLRAKLEAQAARRRDGEAAPVVSTRKPREAKRAATTAAAAAPTRLPAPAGLASSDPAEREQRSLNQKRKLEAAQQHREAVKKRNAERIAKGKPAAAPLPVPSAASIPR